MERGLSRTATEVPAAATEGWVRMRAEELAHRYEELASRAESAAVAYACRGSASPRTVFCW